MFGIEAVRIPGLTGIWVDDRKLGAIGVRVSRWVTSHGFALNVSTDLSYFDLIRPCGIQDRGVTSVAAMVGRPVSRMAVESAIVEAFAAVFDRRLLPASVAAS